MSTHPSRQFPAQGQAVEAVGWLHQPWALFCGQDKNSPSGRTASGLMVG